MWTGSWGEIVAASLLAAAAAGCLWTALRSPLQGRWLLLLGCLPMLVWLKPDLRIFSYHGLIHTSIVYQLLDGPWPPLDPFLAGGALKYAWGHHALVALPCWLFGWTPPTSFAVVSSLLLPATLFLLYQTAGLLSQDRWARVLGTTAAIFGVTLFARGPLWDLAAALGFAGVTRILPIEKFVHVNNNAAGLLFFALHLWAIMEIFVPQAERRARAYALLFLSVLGAAVFYPLSWMPLVASTASCGAISLIAGGRAAWKPVAAAAAAVIGGTAVALPYLLQIMLGRNVEASIGPSLAWTNVTLKSVTVVLAIVGVLLLLALDRRGVRETIRAVPDRVRILIVSAAVNLALYVSVHVPYHSEYKFLLVASMVLGLLAGSPLAALLRRNTAAGVAALALLLLPAASHWVELLAGAYGDTAQVSSSGMLLRQTDPNRDSLNQWALQESSREAVFVDWELGLPPYAHRRVLAVFDRGHIPPPDPDPLFGWTMMPSQFLHNTFGHGLADIRRRYELTAKLLLPGTNDPTDADLNELRSLAGTDEVFVVVRNPSRQKTWDHDPRFERAFFAPPTRVFRLREVPGS